MNIEITSKPITITQAIRQHIQDGFEKLEKFDASFVNAHVIIDKIANDVVVEAKVTIPGNDFFAKAQHEELTTAANKMFDKLKQQLITNKSKQTSRRTTAA